jgi:hypothetical protein
MKTPRVYEQTRKDPRTGLTSTIWSHDKRVVGWKWTGRTQAIQ